MKKAFYSLFLLFILWGCHDQKALKSLCLADSFMLHHPDSSLFLLQKITNPDFFSKKEYAYYALLKTQALCKNYFTFTSDSLIRASVEYYTKTYDLEYTAKAFFYQGVVYDELRKKEQAYQCYKQAENLIPEITDGYLKSLIYEYLGALNSDTGFSSNAVCYYRNALEQAINIQQSCLVVANLKHLGVEYLRLNQIDSAMVYYEQSMEWLPQLSNNEKAGIYHNIGTFYLNHMEAKKILGISFLQKAIDLADASEKLRSYAVLASYYASSEQTQLADSLWVQSLHTEDDYIRAYIFHSRSIQFEQMGDYEPALTYFKKYVILSDSLSALEESQSMAEVQAQYDIESVHRKYSEIRLALTVAILLLVISFCFYQRKKMLNERHFLQQLEENEDRIQGLKTEFHLLNQGGQNTLEQETKRLSGIIEEQLASIAKLEYCSKRKSEMLIRAQSALAGMKFYILALQGDDMSQLNTKELRCLVDCYRQLSPEFFYWLEQKKVDLTPREITLCIFFHMGKNKNEIINMLRCSDGSYRTIKNRIKKEFRMDMAYNDVEAFIKGMR